MVVETRSMKRKRQRLMMQISSWPDVPAIFESLNNDTLTTVLEFVGPKSYKSFGGTNKHCREVYLATKGMTKETFLFGYGPLSAIKDRIEERSDAENDLDLQETVGIGVVFHNRRDVFHWALEEQNTKIMRGICEVAAIEGRIDILNEVLSNVEDEESSIFEGFDQYAARHGKLEILKWFGTKVLYLCEFLCAMEAAEHGHLDIIQWLRKEKGLELSGHLYNKAFCGCGHFHVMKWLREKEVPWCERTFKYVAWNGNLEVLQWLHDEGCPWPEDDDYRVHEGDLKPGVADWLRANGYGDRIIFL